MATTTTKTITKVYVDNSITPTTLPAAVTVDSEVFTDSNGNTSVIIKDGSERPGVIKTK